MQALFALALRRYFVVPMLPELPLVLLELSWLLDPLLLEPLLPEPLPPVPLLPVLEVSPCSAFENSCFESLPSLLVSYLLKSLACSLSFASEREMDPSWFLSSLLNSELEELLAPALELGLLLELELGLLLDPVLLDPELELGLLALGLVLAPELEDDLSPPA